MPRVMNSIQRRNIDHEASRKRDNNFNTIWAIRSPGSINPIEKRPDRVRAVAGGFTYALTVRDWVARRIPEEKLGPCF